MGIGRKATDQRTPRSKISGYTTALVNRYFSELIDFYTNLFVNFARHRSRTVLALRGLKHSSVAVWNSLPAGILNLFIYLSSNRYKSVQTEYKWAGQKGSKSCSYNCP